MIIEQVPAYPELPLYLVDGKASPQVVLPCSLFLFRLKHDTSRVLTTILMPKPELIGCHFTVAYANPSIAHQQREVRPRKEVNSTSLLLENHHRTAVRHNSKLSVQLFYYITGAQTEPVHQRVEPSEPTKQPTLDA